MFLLLFFLNLLFIPKTREQILIPKMRPKETSLGTTVLRIGRRTRIEMNDTNIIDILKKRERIDKNNKWCKIYNINKKK